MISIIDPADIVIQCLYEILYYYLLFTFTDVQGNSNQNVMEFGHELSSWENKAQTEATGTRLVHLYNCLQTGTKQINY